MFPRTNPACHRNRTKFRPTLRAVFAAAALLLGASLTARGQLPALPEPGFQVVYDLSAPLDGSFNGGIPVPYATDNSASINSFDRVAYYFELTNPLGVKQYVYVSADPFTRSARELGLPHNVLNPVVLAQSLRRANIISNAVGITTGTNLATARVEMWPGNYVANNYSGVPGGSDTAYDFADGNGNLAAGYGSFQIHNIAANAAATGGQTLFAYNHWGNTDNTMDDVGIGNNPTPGGAGGAGLDWTFSANPTMSRLRLLVLARTVPAKVTLTNWPKNQQFFPRERSGANANAAVVHVSGVETLGGASAAKVKLLRDGAPVAAEFSAPLSYNPAAGSAAFDVPVLLPAERANYDLLLYITKDGTDYLVNRVQDLVAGDVYLIQGQSNADSAMYFGSANAYRDSFVRTYGFCGEANEVPIYRDWLVAQGDGNRGQGSGVGQWGLVMGNLLSSANNVPVAILNGAFPGQPIGFFQRNENNHADLNTNYGQLLNRAQAAGVDQKVRAILFYQGESENDAGMVHELGYTALQQAWNQDYPGVERFYVCQVHSGCGVTQGNVDLRDRQRRFADTLPRHTVMSVNGLNGHNSCHYNFTDGYETHGIHMERLLHRDLYQPADNVNVDAPNPKRILWANAAKTAINVVLRNATDPITDNTGATSSTTVTGSFVLVGSSATVTGVAMQPGLITLTLSGSGEGATAVNYTGSTAGQMAATGPGAGAGPTVVNGAGVGLLTFGQEFTMPRVVRILNPSITGEIDPGTSVNVMANAAVFEDGVSVRSLSLTVQGQPLGASSAAGPGITSLDANAVWTPSQSGVYTLTARAVDGQGVVFTDQRRMIVEPNTPPGNVSGLVVWLKSTRGLSTADGAVAPGALVTRWADQSGNGNHATQSALANMPALAADQFDNGLPGLRFNNSWLSSATGTPLGSYTKIIRHRLFDLSQQNNLLSATQNTPAGHALYYNQGTNAKLFHGGNFAASSANAAANTDILLGATYDASSNLGTLFVDNAATGSGSAADDNSDSTYQVGAFQNSSVLIGAIQEAMVFDRALSADEMTRIKTSREVALLTPYQRWAHDNFNGQDSAPEADPDRDGISNLLEYALGLNPLAADKRVPPHAERDSGGAVALVFDRPTGLQHLAYTVEVSNDLASPNNWQSGASFTMPPAVGASPLGAGFERVTVRAKSPFIDQPRTFYRLRVSNLGN